jgi:hypothetical protein
MWLEQKTNEDRYLMKRMLLAFLFVILLAASSLLAQTVPQDPVLSWMNTIAQQELQQRSQAIGEIHTMAQAEQRKRLVRTKLL